MSIKFKDKVVKATMAGSMLFGTMVTGAMISTPIYAQWPDVGYNHISQEDRTFSTNAEALNYAKQNSYNIYLKYNCAIEYEVVYDGPSRFRAVFYGYGYNGNSSLAPDKNVDWQGRVTVDDLKVRNWAGTNYAETSFSPLNKGDIVDVCDAVDDWYYILYKGKYGFVYSGYIEENPSQPQPVGFTAKVIADTLNVRTDAGTNASIQDGSPLYQNMLVNIVDTKQDSKGATWYKIEVNSLSGWVASEYVSLLSIPACQDVTPDANERAFANGMKILDAETRYFFTEQDAIRWASGDAAGNYFWNKYHKTLYFYVADVYSNMYVVHFYG